ncbi:recombinase family protein [Belnapia sp. T6]|uniref:Recombinase family protein n=2 Tax=Belnapia mucosa TaxID=2804532 RepID=A0ABS1VAV2_9PROT|nr:recombinase family protein [Belnapia mucosa]
MVFLDRPMSRDPHDQLLLQIRGAIAEYERSLITERMRRARLRKLRAGTLLPWTQRRYGYRLDPDRPRDPAGVRLDEAEAAVVRDLFARCAGEDTTIIGLVQHLDRLGIASPRGRRSWSASALRGLLTNPVYLGQVYANRLRTRPAERRRSALLPQGRGDGGKRLADQPNGSRSPPSQPSSPWNSSTALGTDWPIISAWHGGTTECTNTFCAGWSAAAVAAGALSHCLMTGRV